MHRLRRCCICTTPSVAMSCNEVLTTMEDMTSAQTDEDWKTLPKVDLGRKVRNQWACGRFCSARVVILNDEFRCMHRWLGDASAEMRADLPKVHSLASFEMIEIDSPPPYSTWTFGNVAKKCSTDTQRQLALTVQIVPQLSRILWKWSTCYFFIPYPAERTLQLVILPFHAEARNATPESSSDQSQILPFFLSGKNSIHLHPFRCHS